jgi:hypothetical protein
MIRSFVILGLLLANAAAGQPESAKQSSPYGNEKVYVIYINDAGFASSKVTNPRKPLDIGADGNVLSVELHNRTATRRFLATAIVRVPAGTRHGTEKCAPAKDDKESADCTVTVRVDPDRRVPLHRDILAAAKSPQRITLKLRRFGENTAVANAKAYLAIRVNKDQELSEPEDETTATPAGSVGFAVDPRFIADDTQKNSPAVLDTTADHHFMGARRTHLPGNARLDLSRNFGDSANADLSFIFNDADFGDQEEKGTVTADKYRMSIFGGKGITLDFGKYEFVGATSVLPIAETGQGFTVSRNIFGLNISGSYLVKRTLTAARAKRDDGDQADYIVQVRNVAFRDAVFDLIVVGGRDRKLADPHVHHTIGAQGGWAVAVPRSAAVPRVWFGIDAGAYRSNRTRGDGVDENGNEVTTRAGRGMAGVMRTSVAWGIKDEAGDEQALIHHTVALQVAGGSADRPSTSSDDAFTGELESFAPDVIFFSVLADPLHKGSEKMPLGLANKRYEALEYTYTGWAAFPAMKDIEPPSVTIRVAHDRFRTRFLGTMNIGNEVDLQLSAQARKTVTFIATAGYFQPSRPLRSFIERNVWSAGVTVKVEAP